MVLDYFRYDYEFAEPPRVTSLQNTEPTATFADFGEDAHFVADQRGFETIIHHIAGQYLTTDNAGNIVDSRLKLNKVYTPRDFSCWRL
jgi:polyamine oxidase